MAEVIFNYNGKETIIQCNIEVKMKAIFNKFFEKTRLDKYSIYFIYSGNNNINEELTFEELANQDDKIRNKMNIIVRDNNIPYNKNTVLIKKSKDIICPICKENIKIYTEDYNIFLYECRNKHYIDNILFSEFEQTQQLDISKIKCEICKEENKKQTYNNQFYRCISCKINLCPLCKSNHDKTHNIIDYDNKNYICEKHNEIYNLYCKECKENLCMYCENEHSNHEIISYGKIFPNIENIKMKRNELKEKIDKLKNDINEMLNILITTIENIEYYYSILNDIINNYNKKKVNYEILYSINNIYNNNILKDIDDIINDNNINNKFKKIYDIYDIMNKKYINKLKINYKIDKNKNRIRIFGYDFVKNNKEKCKIIIKGKDYDLMEEIDINNIKEIKDNVEVILLGVKNITNMSYMFGDIKGSIPLSSFPTITNWNTKNVTDMSGMFCNCSSLTSLPDISNWNTSNVTDMNKMFFNCISLKSLPDISKWNTSNVIDMRRMFYCCGSLLSLPDISKWNTNKVTNMNGMFSHCASLTLLPDISKWKDYEKFKKSMFYECNKSLKIP